MKDVRMMLGKKSSAAFGQDRFAWFKRLDFLPKGSISQKIRPLGDFGDFHVLFVFCFFFFEVEKKTVVLLLEDLGELQEMKL